MYGTKKEVNYSLDFFSEKIKAKYTTKGSIISEKSILEVKYRSIAILRTIDIKSSTFAAFISLGSKSIDYLDKQKNFSPILKKNLVYIIAIKQNNPDIN